MGDGLVGMDTGFAGSSFDLANVFVDEGAGVEFGLRAVEIFTSLLEAT